MEGGGRRRRAQRANPGGKGALLLSLLLLAAAAGASVEEEPKTPVTWVRVSSELRQLLRTTPVALVLFYDPKCPHCERFFPTWRKLVRKHDDIALNPVAASAARTRLVGADCTSMRMNYFCHKHNIRAFPRLMLFLDGVAEKVYVGGKDFESISSYIATRGAEYSDDDDPVW